MHVKNIKRWFYIHRWTSLISTLFLFMFCLTGLPLIFEDEIDELFEEKITFEQVDDPHKRAPLDSMIHEVLRRYPDEVITYVYFDDKEPQVYINVLPEFGLSPDQSHTLQFDSRTGTLLKDGKTREEEADVMHVILAIHESLLLGLPGALFLAFIGLVFLVSMLSGVLIYAPFMKNLSFATLRKNRHQKLKWLDLHNLTGIITLVWFSVVGITGVINELSKPLFGLWQQQEVKSALQKNPKQAITVHQGLSSIDSAWNLAAEKLPNNTITSINFPGHAYSSPSAYLIWTKGNTALTAKLFNPVLIDARTGEFIDEVHMPWYLRTLELSRPLHFGDYGGLPLKIIWALFDILSIILLISGLFLWFSKRKFYKKIFAEMEEEKKNAY